MSTLSKSVFKSHEDISDKGLLYPFNAMSSIAYLIVALCIPFNSNHILLLIKYISAALSIISFLWWGLQFDSIHIADLLILNYLLIVCSAYVVFLNTQDSYYPYIIFGIYANIIGTTIYTLSDSEHIFKLFKTVTIWNFAYSVILLLYYKHYKILLTLLISIGLKFGDTYGGFKYGTTLFHMTTALVIYQLIKIS